MHLTIGSVFSGIEGIGLGFLRTGGFRLLWQIEKSAYCLRLLHERFPNVSQYADVHDCYGDGGTPRAHHLACVDVLTGGFPCQDISTSGKQAGIDQGKESGLWREQCRLIGEIRPHYVLVENVAALRSASKRKGDVRPAGLGRVLGDLAALGYDAEWHCLPVSALGAPHRRDRVFVLAYSQGQRRQPQCGCLSEYARTAAWGNEADDYQSNCASKGVREHKAPLVDANAERLEGAELLTGCVDFSAWTGNASGVGLADADSQGLEERPVVAGDAGAQCASVSGGRADGREALEDGTFESRMGRDAAWFSAQLDAIGRTYQWPARPNEQQYPWEPPRVVTERVPERKARIQALGNSVSPASAEAMARLLLLRHAQRGGG